MAPAQRKRCRSCGEVVQHFTDPETGIPQKTGTVPYYADEDGIVEHLDPNLYVWHYRGPRIGWVNVPVRHVREGSHIYTQHDCTSRNDTNTHTETQRDKEKP